MSRKKLNLLQLLTLVTHKQAKIPHKSLVKVRSQVINFVFKSKDRRCIGFSKTSIYGTSKEAGRRHFIKQTHANAMSSS